MTKESEGPFSGPFFGLRLNANRLLLRPLVESDAADLFAVFSDPQVMRYWSARPWLSIDQALQSIARDQAAMAQGKDLRFAIERIMDGRVIGTCSLFQRNEQCRRAEIGFALASSAWYQGYGQESIARCLDYAFDELNLNRIEADVDPRNLASMHCLERLGFNKEGYLRQRWIVDGEISDSVLYGLLASERPQRHSHH